MRKCTTLQDDVTGSAEISPRTLSLSSAWRMTLAILIACGGRTCCAGTASELFQFWQYCQNILLINQKMWLTAEEQQ